MVTTAQLSARLAKVESQRGEADRVMCVVVHGGPPREPADDHDAKAGHLRYDRFDGEEFGEFIARAKAEARAAGQRLLVVRGDADPDGAP